MNDEKIVKEVPKWDKRTREMQYECMKILFGNFESIIKYRDKENEKDIEEEYSM